MEFVKAFEDIDQDGSGEITRDELSEYMHKKKYKPIFVKKWLNIFDADNSGTITLEEFCSTLGLVPNTKHKEVIEQRNKRIEMLKNNEKDEPKEEEITISSAANQYSQPDSIGNYDEHGYNHYNYLGNGDVGKNDEQNRDNLPNSRKAYILDEDEYSDKEFQEFCLDLSEDMLTEFIDQTEDIRSMCRYLKQKLDSKYGRCWNTIVDIDAYGSAIAHMPGYFIHIKSGKFAIMMWKVPID